MTNADLMRQWRGATLPPPPETPMDILTGLVIGVLCYLIPLFLAAAINERGK